VAKIIVCPIKGIEKKAVNKPGSKNHGHTYYLITFLVGSLQNAQVKRTTAHLVGDPIVDAEIVAHFDGLIASKNFGTVQGSFFTVGDKSINPNAAELPAFRTKDDNKVARPEIHRSMEVFCIFDSETDRYIPSPERKALQIINNPDLCEIVPTATAPAVGPDGTPF
jgi:hypothetical protein